jgi:hypothetical protein
MVCCENPELLLRILVGIFYLMICLAILICLALLKYWNIIINIKSKNLILLRKEFFFILYFLIIYDLKQSLKAKSFEQKLKILKKILKK